MEKIINIIEEDKKLIEKKLSLMYNDNSEFSNMCRYSFSVGGKRIRSILFIEAFKSYRQLTDNCIDFAVALELIHNYSLVHDDLPEMDDDMYRRGELSVYGKYGQANAVLVGDELLNDASLLLFKTIKNYDSVFELKNALEVSELIFNLSGLNGMILGQFLDLKNDVKSLEQLREINNLKTGALFKAAIVGGAKLAGASNEDLLCFENYALSLGLAFQLKDDLMDFSKDLNLNRFTFATESGREKVVKKIEELNDFAICEISKISGKKDFFVDFVDFLSKRTN